MTKNGSDQNKLRILVIDIKGTQVIDLVEVALQSREISGKTIELRNYSRPESGLEALENSKFDIVVTDIDFEASLGSDGQNYKTYLEKLSVNGLPIIAVSSSYSAEKAVEAMKAGACDFILKDSGDLTALTESLQNTVERYKLLKKIERERWKSYNVFRQAIDRTHDAILTVVKDGRLSFANQAASTLFEISGAPGTYNLEELFLESSGTKITKAIDAAFRESKEIVIQVEHEKAGQVELDFFPCTEECAVQGVVVIAHQATSAAVRPGAVDEGRMDAISRVVTNLAQRLNNLMTPITSSLGLLAMDEEDPEKLEYLKDAEKSARDITEINRTMLNVGRGSGRQMERIELNDVIRKAVVSFKGEASERTKISETYADNIRPVKGNAPLITDMIINLLRNADKAMTDGGEVSLKTEKLMVDGDGSTLLPGLKGGEYILITIEDEGVGIGSNAMKKVFEPFYSMQTGSGNGLGLPLVYSAVKRHKGSVQLHSDVGKGTKVLITFPVLTVEELDPYTDTDYTVLIIDDEQQVRYMTKKVLERKGCKVLEAENGIKGEEVFTENIDKINAVVLDAMMPQRSGKETLEVLKKIKPEVKVLVFSGCDTDGVVHEMMDLGAADFILKPYNVSDFLEKIINIIEQN